MKKYKSLIFLALLALLLVGCKKKVEKKNDVIELSNTVETQTPETSEVSETPEPIEELPKEEKHDGQKQSKLTGEWIEEKIAERRPYAIMINNISVASPQSGTSQASILYEAIVEGGITRMMGVFEDFDAKRIGSTRSARHYFVSFADEYDAIFVHFGQTKYAVAKIKELGVDNLSGLTSVGSTVFYRDQSIKAPHNAFASYKGIIKGTKAMKYRTKVDKENDNHFTFYDEDTKLKSDTKVKQLTLKFSSYTHPYFVYNSKDNLYYRYQFKKKHIDKTTGEQLCFKNIIVQFVKEWNIDKKGYQTMDIENSSGKGYYISNGKAVSITWKKNESTSKMHYYDENGDVLKINPGKTYIAIFPKDRVKDVVFSEKASN